MLYNTRFSLAIFFCLSLSACGGGGGGNPPGGNSNTDSKPTSHNAGQNCISCHSVGGEAENIAVYNAAGTVYQSNGNVQTNATVNLYIAGTNTLVASLKTDGSGNFYTTEYVDGLFYGTGFVTGVDVEIQAPGGIRTMSGSPTTGACSVCHGVDVGQVIAN